MSTCVKCQLINCTNPADIAIYSLQDALFFNGVPLTFVVNCPEGQVCQPGVYPKTVTYPPGTFVVPNPPPCSGFPIVMTVQGCKGPVTRTLPCPSSNGAIQAAANEIIMELGQQQAECDSEEENPPAPPPPQYANEEVYYTVDCEEGETLTYSGPPLPPYITLDVDNGRLIFAPNTVYGVTQAAANATAQSILNGIGDDAITAGVLTCETGCEILTVSPLPDAAEGENYLAVFSSDSDDPPLWYIVDGALPEGLELDAFSGTLSGTPTQSGTFVFTVSNSGKCEKEFTLAVTGGDFSCINNDSNLGTYQAGDFIFTELTPADPAPDGFEYVWTIISGSLPAGINSSMPSTGPTADIGGEVSGDAEPGLYNFCVQVDIQPIPPEP